MTRAATRAAAPAAAALAVACGGDATIQYQTEEAFPAGPFWQGVPEAGAAVVSDNYSDTLSVIDLAARAKVATVPVGLNPIEREGPHHVAAAPDGSRLYVGISNFVPGSGSGPHGAHGTGADNGYAVMIATADLGESAARRIEPSPGDVTVSRDGRRVYYTHYDVRRMLEAAEQGAPAEDGWASLAVLDAATLDPIASVPVCALPHGVRESPDGSRVYVACEGEDHLAAVDAASFEVTRIPVADDAQMPPGAAYAPTSVHVSPADGRLWASCLYAGQVRVIDPDSAEVVCAIPAGGSPWFGMFLDEGATFLVPVQGPVGSSHLLWIDAATCVVSARQDLDLGACDRAHAIAPGREGSDGPGYLVCEGNRSEPGTFVFLDGLRPGARVEAAAEAGVYSDGMALIYPGLGLLAP